MLVLLDFFLVASDLYCGCAYYIIIIIIIIIDPHHGCAFLFSNGNPHCDLHCNYDHHHGNGLLFSIGNPHCGFHYSLVIMWSCFCFLCG